MYNLPDEIYWTSFGYLNKHKTLNLNDLSFLDHKIILFGCERGRVMQHSYIIYRIECIEYCLFTTQFDLYVNIESNLLPILVIEKRVLENK